MLSSVRWATADDADAIASLHIRAWRAAHRSLGSDELLASLPITDRAEHWRRRLEAPRSLPVAVLPDNGWPMGFCSVSRSENGVESAHLVLDALYVTPERWGAGIGTALLHAVLARRPIADSRTVVLWVHEDNVGARAFFERHGFLVDGACRPSPVAGLEEIRMRLSR